MIRFLQLFEDCNVACENCGHAFDPCHVPEVAMGAVACPKCESHLDQDGRVLRVRIPFGNTMPERVRELQAKISNS